MVIAAAENIEHWRERLNASGLPVFSRTVREIRNISSSRASSAQDLSDVIGHDASMAARIIRIANSPLYNLQSRDIDTINAAVVLVGFDAVGDLVISVSVIEEMLKGHQHARVGQHMALAFHAAAQARSFAKHSGAKTEEVFVGALLKYVGEMAFWSRAEREGMAIEAERQKGTGAVEAERKILGFELSQLSRVLADDWNLGELLNKVLDGQHADEPQVQHVELAHELALVLEQHPWGSAETKTMLSKLAGHLDMKMGEVEEMVCANLDEAAAIADRFGVKKLAETLPKIPKLEAAPEVCAPAEFDARRLFDILSTIAQCLEQDTTRDELMQQVVDGLYQAVGLPRVYFALFSPDQAKLHIKYAAHNPKLVDLSIVAEDDEIFVKAMAEKKAVAFAGSGGHGDNGWHSGGDGMAMVVRFAGQCAGMLYAEAAAGVPLSEDQAAGFRQLSQQITLILAQTAE